MLSLDLQHGQDMPTGMQVEAYADSALNGKMAEIQATMSGLTRLLDKIRSHEATCKYADTTANNEYLTVLLNTLKGVD